MNDWETVPSPVQTAAWSNRARPEAGRTAAVPVVVHAFGGSPMKLRVADQPAVPPAGGAVTAVAGDAGAGRGAARVAAGRVSKQAGAVAQVAVQVPFPSLSCSPSAQRSQVAPAKSASQAQTTCAGRVVAGAVAAAALGVARLLAGAVRVPVLVAGGADVARRARVARLAAAAHRAARVVAGAVGAAALRVAGGGAGPVPVVVLVAGGAALARGARGARLAAAAHRAARVVAAAPAAAALRVARLRAGPVPVAVLEAGRAGVAGPAAVSGRADARGGAARVGAGAVAADGRAARAAARSAAAVSVAVLGPVGTGGALGASAAECEREEQRYTARRDMVPPPERAAKRAAYQRERGLLACQPRKALSAPRGAGRADRGSSGSASAAARR